MQSIELKAMSAAHALEQNGFDHTPVLGILQQRAELLEALKVVRLSGGYHMMHPDTKALVDNAITKAEAAE